MKDAVTITRRIDEKTVKEWKSVYSEYRPRLQPNRKTAAEIIAYISAKYAVEMDNSEESLAVVRDNVTMNDCFAKRIPEGNVCRPLVLFVNNEGEGIRLYDSQESVFKGIPIRIGLEEESGCVFVEGSGALADEVTVFMGLDEDELDNFYLVANYIRCLKKAGMLEA